MRALFPPSAEVVRGARYRLGVSYVSTRFAVLPAISVTPAWRLSNRYSGMRRRARDAQADTEPARTKHHWPRRFAYSSFPLNNRPFNHEKIYLDLLASFPICKSSHRRRWSIRRLYSLLNVTSDPRR